MTDIPERGAIDPNGAVPAKPDKAEIATSGDGRDITVAFIGTLLEMQDTVLKRLGNNYEVYRELRRDGQVHSTFQQRRLALRSRPFVIEPGADDAASIAAADHLRQNLEQIPFDRSSGLMSWGAFYGFSVGECMWDRKKGKTWLKKVKVRTPWRFRFAPGGELRLLTRSNMINGETMPPAKFWTTSWGADNDDDPYGLGLAHQLYWPVFFKKQGLGFWLRALEKFGAPTGMGTYPAGSDKKTQDDLLRAIHRMRMDGSIVVPEGTTVSLLEAARGTVDQAAFNRAMNAEISKIVLGQTMTTDDGASLSQSEVHMEVREELTDADAEELCESFMAGPGTWLTVWNFPGAAIPIMRRPAPEDEERAAKLITAKAGAVAAMKAAGFEPTDETVASLFGDGWVRVPTPAPVAGSGPLQTPALPPGHRTAALAPAFAEGEPQTDAIDDFGEVLDWSVMEEPIAFLEKWLGKQPSLEAALSNLPGLAVTMPIEGLRKSIAHACFEAAAAGRAGLSLSNVEDEHRAGLN
ncbi:hypothetical protein D3C71_314580 [compost metagenome]